MKLRAPIAFDVRAPPVPQGSSRAFVIRRKTGPPSAIVTHDAKGLAGWRHLVQVAAQDHAPFPIWAGPVRIRLDFRLAQPKSRPNYRGRGKKREKVRWLPDRRPDLDKLVRAVLDALTGVIWHDDTQVVSIAATKSYGPPGLSVRAESLEDLQP